MLAQGAILQPDSWLSVIRFAGAWAEKKRQAIADLVAQKKESAFKRQEAANRLAELRRTSVPARVMADLALQTQKAGKVTLTIRYAVDHVTWYPVYELRANEDAAPVPEAGPGGWRPEAYSAGRAPCICLAAFRGE